MTARDEQRPVRLLAAERGALLPILRSTPEPDFDRPTACPGWSVRDVLAHCGSALSRVASGDLHAFTPELNEIDVAERRSWPLPRVLAELTVGYEDAGPKIAASGGRLDAIALGEWVHGGDVRDALGQPLAYASAGFGDACALLADFTRRQRVPLIEATLGDLTVRLGVRLPGRPVATLVTDNAMLMRLFAGRPAPPAGYRLAGAEPEELIVF
jgi:uncharacterized protein (TIGR03083 family)